MTQRSAGNYYDLAKVKKCLADCFHVQYEKTPGPNGQTLARRRVGGQTYKCDMSDFESQISETELRSSVLRRLGRIEWPEFQRKYQQTRR